MTFFQRILNFFKKKPKPAEPVVEVKKPVERPSKSEPYAKSLWYPNAQIMDVMKPAGKYPKGYPEGAIVHWTSGWSRDGDSGISAEKHARNAINYGAKMGYGYFVISEKGLVLQGQPLDSWDSHAGTSYWPSLGDSVSKYLVGIEICNAGRLDKKNGYYESWFGAKFSEDEVRYSPKKDNVAEGYYHKYSKEQEEALIRLLLWLKNNNPDVFSFDLVLGHDEVAPKRKTDPGASLSMTMPEFRRHLKLL